MAPTGPRLAASSLSACRATLRRDAPCCHRIHTTSVHQATPLPHPTVAGPPPSPPKVSASQPEERVARKRERAELLLRGQALRVNPAKPGSALQKRFWKDVTVKTTDEGLQITLDTRPVRTASKQILSLPHRKRALATAIALEWDQLVSAQQALKHHYIPLTSLTSRAVDIRDADSAGNPKIREDIVNVCLRYLSTDTLLCWVPEHNPYDTTGMGGTGRSEKTKKSLRETQMAIAEPIIAYIRTHVFPGVDIVPILEENSIMPIAQPQTTQDVIRGWITGLSAFELAALERGVLATKSLLIAIRLLVEWSEEYRHLQPEQGTEKRDRFGVQEAATASTVEVKWQTNMWGEVEDSHDVSNEDIVRQLGSVVLLVS